MSRNVNKGATEDEYLRVKSPLGLFIDSHFFSVGLVILWLLPCGSTVYPVVVVSVVCIAISVTVCI